MDCRSRLGEVTVWWMECGSPTEAVVAQWRDCLDAAELAQADRFHFDEDRSTYIAAHWLVRHALASVGGLLPADWRFIAEKHGKPGIDPALGRPDLRFNLSHTRGFVACAVGFGNAMGIDVEALSRRPSDLDIAERFFSPSEVAILRGTAQDQKRYTFLRFWTLKEALIKATGDGLSRGLDSFSFTLDPVSIAFKPGDTDAAVDWSFYEMRPTPGHLLALAVRHLGAWPVKLSTCQQQPDGRATIDHVPNPPSPDPAISSVVSCAIRT
jgi:4'-phosphopantetheinyl transferase